MSAYNVNREGDRVSIWIHDGRAATAKRAREIVGQSIEPWEVLHEGIADAGGGMFLLTVDRERSVRRKAVLDAILLEMDQTDANYTAGDDPGHEIPSAHWYLADIHTLCERILEGEI